MKIIREGTRTVRDILSTYYHCHNCGCVFSLEKEDLEYKKREDIQGIQVHISDPMRYQECPTCGQEIAIYDRKNWKPGPKAMTPATTPSTTASEYDQCMYSNHDDRRAQLDCIGLQGTPDHLIDRDKPDSGTCWICGKTSSAMTWNHARNAFQCDFFCDEPPDKPVSTSPSGHWDDF